MCKPLIAIIVIVSFISYVFYPLRSPIMLAVVLTAFLMWYLVSRKTNLYRKEKKEVFSDSLKNDNTRKVVDMQDFRRKLSQERENQAWEVIFQTPSVAELEKVLTVLDQHQIATKTSNHWHESERSSQKKEETGDGRNKKKGHPVVRADLNDTIGKLVFYHCGIAT